jgi:putative flippase GtrA
VITESRKQPARYLLSAGLCAIANNILLIVGAQAGLNLLELILLSFVVIGTTGYVAHVYLTFRQAPSWASYVRFMAGIAIGIPVAFVVLLLLRDVLRMPMTLAAPTATLLLLVYNFLNAKLAIMRRIFR